MGYEAGDVLCANVLIWCMHTHSSIYSLLVCYIMECALLDLSLGQERWENSALFFSQWGRVVSMDTTCKPLIDNSILGMEFPFKIIIAVLNLHTFHCQITYTQFGGFPIHSAICDKLGEALFHIALWEMVDIAVWYLYWPGCPCTYQTAFLKRAVKEHVQSNALRAMLSHNNY